MESFVLFTELGFVIGSDLGLLADRHEREIERERQFIYLLW